MSKSLIYEAYSHVPTYNEIENIGGVIKNFVEETLGGLSLRNVSVDGKGKHVLSDGVMDFEAEIRNVLEGLAISDYFFDRDFNEIWMEESERIETLWITMDRKKGNLNLKFDASNMEYLEILIKYGIRFNEADMNSALEIYEKYETKLNQQITGHSKIAIGQ